MAEWVALGLICDVCDRDMGYEGGRRLREPCWRQMVDRKQLGDNLIEISEVERTW